MTREQAVQKAKIMQAYADGEIIQIFNGAKLEEHCGWVDLENPMFISDIDRYRIKPKDPRKFIIWTRGLNMTASLPENEAYFHGQGWTKIPVTEDIP